MASVAELGEQLANLTIAQAVELKNLLKDKYGIEPAGGGRDGRTAPDEHHDRGREARRGDRVQRPHRGWL